VSNADIPIMDYEGSRWREEFWRGREYEDQVEHIALTHLLPPSGQRLVEIGAGFGRLADLYQGYQQVVLLDYARSMLYDARERLGDDSRYIFVAADLYDLPFADSACDTALTVRVLHHVADIPRAFAEVSRIVRSRGTYITDFANKRHIKAILKYFLRRNGTSPFTLEPYEFAKLNFDYHPSYISQNLLRNWFAVREERAVSTFRVGALKRRVPASLLASLDGAIQRPTANLQLSPSIFLRAESEKPGAPRINPALWRCLNCHATEMAEQGEGLRCNNCGRFYPRVDGIYDFKKV
jgi:SAM-dependent methyltransferase